MDNKEFKNKKQPELTDNRTAWRSDNQGVEETFIQTSRRGRDGQPDGEDSQPVSSWRTGTGEVVAGGAATPHLHADKPGGIAGEPDILSNPGFH